MGNKVRRKLIRLCLLYRNVQFQSVWGFFIIFFFNNSENHVLKKDHRHVLSCAIYTRAIPVASCVLSLNTIPYMGTMYAFVCVSVLPPVRHQVDRSENWLSTADQAAVPASLEHPLLLLICFFSI